MNSYPRDEFDDIDEATARRGAYRAVAEDQKTSTAGVLAMVICGLLALLVGGTMFVLSPRTAAPDAGVSAASSAPTVIEEPAPTANPASVSVEVYNSAAPAGSAAQVTAALEEAGYTVVETANWEGVYTPESLVYFATGASTEASVIAEALGLPTIVQDFEAETGLVYVVLGADFDPSGLPQVDAEDAGAPATADEVSSAPVEQATAEPTADSAPDFATYPAAEPTADSVPDFATYPAAEPTADSAPEPATDTQRFSYDPASGTYYLDPAGVYIFDAVTGTYQLG